MAKVLVLYYSAYGHIETMAERHCRGCPRSRRPGRHQARAGTGATRSRAKAAYYKLDQPAPVAAVADLADYDAIIVGTGTRFGRMSSQMANFLDQAGGLWAKGALNGKVGAAFTSTAVQHGGQETTLFSIITNLLHFGMVVVGMDYGYAAQMTLEEIVGGAPYGATTIAGGDGSRQAVAEGTATAPAIRAAASQRSPPSCTGKPWRPCPRDPSPRAADAGDRQATVR